ncbi:MAG: hypothetical protein ACM3NH_00785 [Candidatus Saccharibacteria bacterium]
MAILGIFVGILIILGVGGFAWKELDLPGFFGAAVGGLWNMLLSFFIKTFRIRRG